MTPLPLYWLFSLEKFSSAPVVSSAAESTSLYWPASATGKSALIFLLSISRNLAFSGRPIRVPIRSVTRFRISIGEMLLMYSSVFS